MTPRNAQRGSAGIYFSFALLISIATGVGVYMVLRDRAREQRAADAAAAVERAKHPPRPTPAPTPTPTAPAEAAAPVDDVPRAVSFEQIAAETATEPPAGTAGIAFGAPGLAGRIEHQSIMQQQATMRRRITRCIDRGLAAGTATSGRMVASVRLDDAGAPTEVSVDGDTDASLRSCVRDVFGGIRFNGQGPGAYVFKLAVTLDQDG